MKALNYFLENYGRKIFIVFVLVVVLVVLYFAFDALQKIFFNIEGVLKNINKF